MINFDKNNNLFTQLIQTVTISIIMKTKVKYFRYHSKLKSNKVLNQNGLQIYKINRKNIAAMDCPSPLKKRGLAKKLNKLLKQQSQQDEEVHYEPGKVQIVGSTRCTPKIVNFFGDVHNQVYCMHTSSTDEMVAVGCSNGDVKVYTISQGKIMLMGNTSRLSGYPNTGIRWHPKSNKQLTACNCDGTIKWYDIQNQVATAHHQSDVGYLCTDYNSDGTWCVFGNEKHQIEIYDGEFKKLMLKYQAGSLDSLNPNHFNRVFCVKGLKSDNNLFFSGGWDGSVRLWDVRIPDGSVRKFGGPMVSADSLDLKNNVLLAGNYATKDTVQYWDFNSGNLIKTINLKQQPTQTLYCFAATYAHRSKYNLAAVGLSGVNKVKIIQGDEIIAQFKFQASPLCLQFYKFHDKDFLLASGVEGTVYQIKIKINENK